MQELAADGKEVIGYVQTVSELYKTCIVQWVKIYPIFYTFSGPSFTVKTEENFQMPEDIHLSPEEEEQCQKQIGTYFIITLH